MERYIFTKTYIEKADNVVITQQKETVLHSDIPPPKGFIGREVELAILRAEKERGKTSFVLHGLGGVGKTDLALEFIDEIKSDERKAYRVNMFGLSENALSATGAMLEIIKKFVPEVPAELKKEEIENLYAALLNKHKPILLFDNTKDRTQVEQLNNAAAFIVITSRTNFNVTGGFAYEVEQMSVKDARDLLNSIAEERLDAQADQLAKLAGYLPMALLPLAGLLAEDKTLDAEDLVQRYSARKERLRLADPNREDLSVEASFDLSYEVLSEELKERWRKLAVFPADFNSKAMYAVWEVSDGWESRSELVKRHLLEFDRTTKRARLHDLARDYTSEKLSKNQEELFRATIIHCVHFGELVASFSEPTLLNLAKFDVERRNIEQGFACLSNKIEQGDFFAKTCQLYIAYATEVLLLRLHWREYIKWLEIGLKAATKVSNQEYAGNHLGNLGIAYFSLGEYRKAIEYHEQALKIAQEIGDRQGEGSSLGNLGNAYLSLGESRRAIEYHKQALHISREISDGINEASDLGNLGNAYDSLGEHRKAIKCFEKALNITKEFDDRQGEINCLGNLGNAYNNLSEYRKAIECFNKALDIAQEYGDQNSESISLGNLGLTYNNLGEYRKAIEYYEQALKIAQEIEYRQGEGNTLGNLGNLYRNLGEYQKAIEFHERSIRIAQEIGDRNGESNQLGNLGLNYIRLEQPQMGIEYFIKSLNIAKEIEDPYNESRQLCNLGNAYDSLGESRRAIEYYEKALNIAKEIGYRQGEGNTLGNLGIAYYNLGEKVTAKSYYMQAIEILVSIESPNVELVQQHLASLDKEI